MLLSTYVVSLGIVLFLYSFADVLLSVGSFRKTILTAKPQNSGPPPLAYHHYHLAVVIVCLCKFVIDNIHHLILCLCQLHLVNQD